MTPAERTILLADDSANNAQLVKVAFRKAGYENPIHALCRGEDVLEYLKGQGEYADRAKFPLPHLVLLDTRMLGMTGWEVLIWVRKQPEFALLPVIVFTGSEHPGDKQKAEELGANAYEIKPQRFDEFIEVIRKMADFWLRGG